MSLLDTISDPAQLRGLSDTELDTLALDLREKMIRTVSRTGGHLASSLGAVEIAIALHRVMDSPRDRIVWDTGHQAYAHKLLTGRCKRFDTLRQVDGVGGFPRRSESEHDVFDGGHAGTARRSSRSRRSSGRVPACVRPCVRASTGSRGGRGRRPTSPPARSPR
jgi:1-deoxy-D-xylulose-5-phosphate synthase